MNYPNSILGTSWLLLVDTACIAYLCWENIIYSGEDKNGKYKNVEHGNLEGFEVCLNHFL